MRKKLTCAVAGAVGIAALAAMVPLASTAGALPSGTAPNGTATLSPGTGTSSTNFTLAPPAGSTCPGSGDAGYRYQSYIAPRTVDIASLVYSVAGTPNSSPLPTQNVRQGSTQVRGLSPDIGTNFVLPVNNVNFTSTVWALGGVTSFVAGEYFAGLACTLPNAAGTANDTVSFWRAPVTVTAASGAGVNGFNYAVGFRPSAPVLASPLTVGDGSLSGSVNVVATPDTPVTALSVTATPQGGGAPLTGTVGSVASPVTFPVTTNLASVPVSFTGLANGTVYDVKVTATGNPGLPTAESNVVSGTPSQPPRPPVTNLSAAPGAGKVTLSWTTPTGVAPTGYTVGVSPTISGAPFTVGAVTTYEVTGLAPGTVYTFTVTPLHPAPFVGTAASVQAAPGSAQSIQQQITVVRPVGQLVLTQRCGVNGELPAVTATNAFPGFPRNLAILPASADQVGTSPDTDLSTPGVQPDPGFGDYPVPANPLYPTRCGVSLGTAQLVSSGPLAGQFYSASGAINQVSVADARDIDAGWRLNATMGAFSAGTETFEGNYLGWNPVVTRDSAPFVTSSGANYDQTVVAGPGVLPGTGVGTSTPGLGDTRQLASATAGQGLGVADLNARLLLLIPTTANAGTYTGILTFDLLDTGA